MSIPTRFLNIALLCPVLVCLAQPAGFVEAERAVHAKLAEGVPGLSIAVVSGRELVYSKAFGVSSVETRATLTPDMLFRVGSTTKLMVAATLLGFEAAGKLDRNTPVGHYIPDLPAWLAALTPHQLLSHQSGLADRSSMEGPHDDSALEANVRSIDISLRIAKPGEIFSYSNLGYSLAGLLAGQAAGKPFADAVQTHFFAPLGMARSTFRPTTAMTYPLAVGHTAPPVKVDRPMADDAGYWPAGSAFTSTVEFARFAIAFFNDGVVDGARAIDPAVIRQLSTPQAPAHGSDATYYTYGLFSQPWRNIRVLEHGGARRGYNTLIRMAAAEKVAVIIFCNRSGCGLSNLADKYFEAMIPSTREAPSSRPALDLDNADAEAYVSAYQNGARTITIGKNEKGLTYTAGRQAHDLQRVSADTFVIPAEPGRAARRVVFIRDAAGSIAFLHTDNHAFVRRARARARSNSVNHGGSR